MQTKHGDVLTSEVPVDYGAEKAVLCCVMLLGTDCGLLKALKPEDFASDWCRWVYHKLWEHRKLKFKTQASILDYLLSRKAESESKGVSNLATGLSKLIVSEVSVEDAHFYFTRLRLASHHRKSVEEARKRYLQAWSDWDETESGKRQDARRDVTS